MKIPDRSQKGKATLCSTFVVSAGQPVETNCTNGYTAPDIHRQGTNILRGLCQSKEMKDEFKLPSVALTTAGPEDLLKKGVLAAGFLLLFSPSTLGSEGRNFSNWTPSFH